MAAMSDPKPPGAYASDIKMSGLVQLIAYDVGLPLLGFYGTRALGGSVMTGLVVATAVAAVRLVWQIVRHRKVDPFSAMMLLLVGGSLAISFFTGDPRFMLSRSSQDRVALGRVEQRAEHSLRKSPVHRWAPD